MDIKNSYKTRILLFNDFFLIDMQDKNSFGTILEVLKKIIDYSSAYIFYINPDKIRVEASYQSNIPEEVPITKQENESLLKGKFSNSLIEQVKTKSDLMVEPLSIKNTIFGYIAVDSKQMYSEDDRIMFHTCSLLISKLVKDIEINSIINLQMQALKEAINTIKNKNNKIMKADKIKSDFLANASHELRTPLNSIIGFSDLLSQEFIGTLNPKQKEYVADIKVSSLHLLGMINGLLDMSKVEARAIKLNLSEFPIKQLINEVLNIIEPLSKKKNIHIDVNLPDLNIKADYQKLQQILFNLLSNAIKFSYENSKIEVSSVRDDSGVQISVTDYGIGIAKKNHTKIFKKFEQISSSKVGNINSTGLGLTIIKELAKLHKGKIEVRSELDEGSTFTLILPFL